jgi:hypothetical protein
MFAHAALTLFSYYVNTRELLPVRESYTHKERSVDVII